MIKDAQLIFSDAQAETTVAAHDSTNVIDLGAHLDAFGGAEDNAVENSGKLWLNVKVVTAFTSGGSATLATALQDSADNSSFAAVTPAAVATAAIPVASLTAGYTIIKMPLPSGLRRYLKLVYTIGTAAMTAGAIDAWISHGS